MNKLNGKIVFITGASSGIGAACARVFAEEGARLILTARRMEKLEETAEKIKAEFGSEILTLKLDVTDYNMVKEVINTLPGEWKNIDILINNAGLAMGVNKVYEDDPAGWDVMLDTNVKGLLAVTKQIVPGMAERKSGHVINLGSIAGHMAYPGGGVYCSTKHAVKAITETLRMELLDKNVRVSSVDPGMVETEFSVVRYNGNKDKADKVYKGVEPLTADDIADAVLYCATRKPHVNISDMIIMPTQQANAFVTYRK